MFFRQNGEGEAFARTMEHGGIGSGKGRFLRNIIC